MALLARHLSMLSLEGKRGEWMGAKADLLREPRPTNARVAALTPVPELGVVDLGVTGNALRACARRVGVALVVTSLALRLRMPRRETQARVIAPDVGDLGPVGLVVARSTLGSRKPVLVRILVARDALGLQSKKGRVPTTVPAIMTFLTSSRGVSSFERPPRESMVEAVPRTAGPPNELGIPSEMLDVTLAAVLSSIFATVQARLLPDPRPEIVVAGETSVGIESLTRGVAFVAFRIPLELRVRVAELAWGQELGAGPAGHPCARNGGRDHHWAEQDHGLDPPAHSEKIHR